jgi:hypothetical protein
MDIRSARQESPEQLIDVFKAAALSVTKLYKSSVAAETRARQDGYQDCLEDLLNFLDKEGTATGDKDLSRIRRWAADRRDGRDATLPTSESEDETDKPELSPPAETATAVRGSPEPTSTTQNVDPPIEVVTTTNDSPHFVVPSQDFTFQSEHQYPNIATLDLSDTRPHGSVNHSSQRASRNRANRTGVRSTHLGRGAGTKRRMDFDDFFGGCLGGKDPFGNNGKRSRHT